MNTDKYIVPSKEQPVFVACYTLSGVTFPIDDEYSVSWRVSTKDRYVVGHVYAVDLTIAIKLLHEYIRRGHCNDNSIKYEVRMITGAKNRQNEVKRVKVYSITGKQAKQWRVIK